MRLVSTTWDGRNREKIREVPTHVHQKNLLVADIGVGGISEYVHHLLPKGPKEEMTRSQKVQRFFFRQLDNILRKYNVHGRLVQFELDEVKRTLAHLHPTLIAVDRDPRVLRHLPEETTSLEWDISERPLPFSPHLVFCYNVIQTTKDPERTLAHVCTSVSPGGFLSLDTGKTILQPPNFKQLTPFLYQRLPR